MARRNLNLFFRIQEQDNGYAVIDRVDNSTTKEFTTTSKNPKPDTRKKLLDEAIDHMRAGMESLIESHRQSTYDRIDEAEERRKKALAEEKERQKKLAEKESDNE